MLRNRPLLVAIPLIAAIVSCLPWTAWAIIHQVDGTIVPQSSRLQSCLDKSSVPSSTNPAPGEGMGVLDAVRDASIYPQTFTPTRRSDGRRVVTLTVIGEGGGFRDRFGWYNVGDSPFNPSARHEIFGCRDRNFTTGCACPCTSGPRGSIPSPAPACTNWINPNIVEVDFDCLQARGTWRGGPIAFYILTPETFRPCSSNAECSAYGPNAYCSTSVGRCIWGSTAGQVCPAADATEARVYSTDNAINDDGDYVHFLIYTSRTFPNAFYFGWEDLFRGGDNDFEDMLIRAVGLVPFCNPTPEVCDGRDNDCDGMIDDGVGPGGSCGIAIGECRAGMLVCEGGRYVCRGVTTGSPEVCDGRDNDCDGTVDEGDPGGGGTCDRAADGTPLCTPGVLHCRGGRLVCEGGTPAAPEVCDCEDNDCDGSVDEPPASGASLCPGGAACIACGCRTPCQSGEFPCSLGQVCRDGFCVPPLCGTTICRDHETCRDGRCVDACSTITCSAGYVCRASSGTPRCVENNCYGLGCPEPGQICRGGQCVPDPCRDRICGPGEFCRDGECVRSCADVRCHVGQRCRDGVCVDDPCAVVSCNSGYICRDRRCVPDPCVNISCGAGRVCRDGECIDDPCAYISCPGAPDVVCQDGQCIRPGVPPLPYRERVVGTGGGGLTCTASPGSLGNRRSRTMAVLTLAVLAVTVARRKRTRRANEVSFQERFGRTRRVVWFLVLATMVFASGCVTRPYCLNCNDDAGALPETEVRDIAPIEVGCIPTGEEVCDGRDNDCDGVIDEGFDTQTDPRNCGTCGTSCAAPHAIPRCVAGRCAVRSCDVGWYDLDRNPSNGCEYSCTPTASGELCDGRDNDCNGMIDEGFDLRTDVMNCGRCRNECRYTRAAARCEAGRCVMGPCEPGFVDLDGNPATGCEYACTATGSEVCDGRDNDCDGMVDEGCLRLFPSSDVRLDQGSANSVRPVIQTDGAGTLGVMYMDLRNGESDIYFARSTNEGMTWMPDVRLDTSSPPGSRDSVGPALAWARTRVVAAWSDFRTSNNYREVWTNVSSNNGASFATGDVRANSGTNDAFNVRLVASASTIVAVWEELLPDRSRQIRFARSVDGTTWTSGRIDHAPPGTIASAPAIALGGATNVYVAWHDNRHGLTDVFFNRSTDGGQTWQSSDLRMDTDPAGSHSSQNPSIAADDGGRVYVAWQDVRTGRSFDIYVRVSSNGGATFGARDVRLDTTAFDQDSIQPTVLTLSGSRAVVVWQDNRWGRPNLYASTTRDGGMTWSSSDVQVMSGRGRSSAIHFAAAATGDTVFVVWSDDRNGRLDIYANYSNDGGNTFQPDDVRLDTGSPPGAADSETPAVVAARGMAHVVWVDRRSGGIIGDIYYRSLRP